MLVILFDTHPLKNDIIIMYLRKGGYVWKEQKVLSGQTLCGFFF